MGKGIHHWSQSAYGQGVRQASRDIHERAILTPEQIAVAAKRRFQTSNCPPEERTAWIKSWFDGYVGKQRELLTEIQV